MNNELSRELSYAKEKVQYDTQCKRVLSQKQILAWILRRTVKEFTHLSVEQIIPCIEGEAEISSVPVYPGEKISGMSNEDKVPGEGAVYFDIRFRVSLPQGDRAQMIVNVEAQKSFYPGYPIVTRGIFYGARMISAQSGIEFKGSDYDKIKKVYSIWLCMNAPKKIGNAIAEYSFRKRDLLPGLPDCPQAYDKISVIIIALNETVASADSFIGMINTLLSTKIPYIEKKKALEKNYHLQMHSGLEREVDLMCNLSDYVEEQGIQKGIQQGIQQGLAIGREEGLQQGLKTGIQQGLQKGLQQGLQEGTRTVVFNLLRMGTLTDEDIMKAGNLSFEELQELKKELET